MIFKVKNETGSSVTIGGTTYTNGSWVDFISLIKFQGITFQRNDIDGSNAGRAKSGYLVRDRVAVKGKWTVATTPLKTTDVSEIYKLLLPETFHLKTDYPNGSESIYEVYTNNISVPYLMTTMGSEYTGEISIPFVEC